MGRTGLVAFHWRRSTTVKPARSNIACVPTVGRSLLATRSPVGTLVQRVSLQRRRAVGPGVLDRRLEERRCDALAADGAARPRSRRSTRPGRSSSGAGACRGGEPLVVLARREAHPTDGTVVPVRDEPGSQLALCERLQLGAIAGSRRIRPVATLEPEIGAPAPLRVAAFVEQFREVCEAIRSERLDAGGDRFGHRGRCYSSGPRETRDAVRASTG